MTDRTKHAAAKYVGKVGMQFFLAAASFFCTAGTLHVPRGNIYFSFYLLTSVFGCLYLLRSHSETLAARNRIASNTKNWDRLFLAIYVPLAYCLIYIAAALPQRLAQPYPPMVFFWIGIILHCFSSILLTWSVHENRHFESSVRIQTDRQHRVCSTGPYAIVRHPGYSGILIWAIAMAFMFGKYACIVSVVSIILVCTRTALEDATLHKELPGYQHYATTTRYRLIPFLW